MWFYWLHVMVRKRRESRGIDVGTQTQEVDAWTQTTDGDFRILNSSAVREKGEKVSAIMAASRVASSTRRLCLRYKFFFYIAIFLIGMQLFLAWNFYSFNQEEMKKLEVWQRRVEALENKHQVCYGFQLFTNFFGHMCQHETLFLMISVVFWVLIFYLNNVHNIGSIKRISRRARAQAIGQVEGSTYHWHDHDHACP